MKKLGATIWVGALCVALAGCGSDDSPKPEVPQITSFTPASGPTGTLVQVTGTGFSAQGYNVVRFNGKEGQVSSWSVSLVAVTVPIGATTGKITVTTPGGTATSAEDFTVTSGPIKPPTQPPTITSFSPMNGPIGTKVTIVGTYFAETGLTDNTVTIGGALATVVSATATELQVTVPDTAVTGRITVQTVAGKSTSKVDFTVSKVPLTPTNLTAIAVSSTQINLSWGASNEASGYNIYRTTTPGVTVTAANKLAASPVAATLHSDTGLTTGTAYYYVVTAVNANGESKPSAEVSATPTSPPPAPPTITGFSPTNGIVGSTVTITGTNYSTIATNNTVAFNGVAALVNAATTTTLTATVPVGATTGFITVTTAAGTAKSATAFTVLTPPDVPSNPTATAVSATQINLSWGPANKATGYNIYRAVLPGVALTAANKINAAPVALPPYNDTGLTTGTEYFYVVTSVNANGESGPSKEVSAVPTAPPPAPPTITSFTPTSGPVGSVVTITGTNFATAATNNTVAFNGVPGVVITASSNQLTATVPAGATTGYITVTTAAGAAKSAGQFAVLGTQPPTISGFAPTNGTVGTAVTISGSNFSTQATANTVTFNNVPAVVTAATATQLTTAVPAGATTGFIKVTTSAGTATSATQFTVLTPPAAPTGLTAVAVSASQVNLTWNTVSAATGYNLYRGTSPGVTPSSGTKVSVTSPPHSDTGLTAGTTYYYVVTAVNANGEGAASAEASATPTNPPPAPPTITSFSPTSGPVSAPVTITGTNFAVPSTNNTVTFNGVPASVTTGTTTQLDVTVPAGATTGPIKVTTAAGTATSASPFTVTSTAPVAPGGVAAVPGVGQITISWTPVTGATSYNIYFTTGATPPTKTSGTKLASVTSPYKHNNLSTNLTYNYVVTAVNTSGESDASSAVSATPAIPIIVGRLVSGIPQTILQNNIEVSVKDNLGAPISNASVSVNGTNLAYDATKKSYKGYCAVAKSTPVDFKVTINGSTYALPEKISGESTGYTGDGSDLSFTGQALDKLPVSPGTVVVKPTAGGTSVDARDTYGDGVLWSVEAVPVQCGTINYTTGALALQYPTGKAPATGAITADYRWLAVSEFASYPAITAPLDGAQNPPPITVKWDCVPPATGSYNYGIIVFDTVSINPYWEDFLYWNNFISPTLANPPAGSGIGSIVPSLSANSGNVALFVYINKTQTVTLDGAVGGVSVGSIDIIGASVAHTIVTN